MVLNHKIMNTGILWTAWQQKIGDLSFVAANIVSSSIQPLQNIGVLKYIGKKVPPDEKLVWVQYHIGKGFADVDSMDKQQISDQVCNWQISLWKAMDMNLLESLVTSTRDVNSDKMVSDLQLKASIHHNILLRVAHSIAEAQLMDNASFVLLDKTFDEFASLWMNMKVEVKTKEDHEARQFKFKPRAFKIENIMEIDISTLGGSLENEILSEWQELLSDEKVAEKKAEEEDDTLEEEWNLMKGSILNNMVHIHNQLFGSMDLVETENQ
ncbi:midasin-like [Camellia sinensis]|uniref:midasin-like n=1 Tax=Camellia sinensis TaxID=4442 RepID=UPI001035C77A|nr:midasin-like [Camellia sinensis]